LARYWPNSGFFGPIPAKWYIFFFRKAIMRSKKPPSVDDLLAEHLEQAEHHLIEAINLFSRSVKPVRDSNYLKRLGGAQETITALYRTELVRIRGEFKPPKIRRLKKVA
jgi:hypothetical protein